MMKMEISIMRCLLTFLLMLTFFTTSTISLTTTKMTKNMVKNKNRRGTVHEIAFHVPGRRVRIFLLVSHSHLFNKIDIHQMHKYSSPLYLVVHTLTQAIMRTDLTLEPQDES